MSLHCKCTVQHFGVIMAVAKGMLEQAGSWPFSPFFNFFFFPYKNRLWVQHSVLGPLGTVALWKMPFMECLGNKLCSFIFHQGKGNDPKFGVCYEVRASTANHTGQWAKLYGFQESAGLSPLPGASLTWRNPWRTRDRQSGANHSPWPPPPFRQILNVK